MRTLALSALAAMLFACSPRVPPIRSEKVAFPREWAGAKLDFEVLRAIKVAADDFVPPHPPWIWLFETDADRCIWSPRSLDYEVTDTSEVVFVRLRVNPRRCGVHRVIADAGAKYAVRRSDGLILRTLSAAEPDDWPPEAEEPNHGKDAHDGSKNPSSTGVEHNDNEEPEQGGPSISRRVGDRDCACTSRPCRR